MAYSSNMEVADLVIIERFSPFFFVVSKIIPKFAASHVLANASDLHGRASPLWVKRAVLFYEKDVF